MMPNFLTVSLAKFFPRIDWTYFLFGAVILVEVAATVFFVWPKSQEVWQMRERVEAKRKKVESLQKTLETISSLDTAKLTSGLALVSAALPDGKKVSGVVSGVSKVASASGVALSTLEFSPGKVSTGSSLPATDTDRGEITVGPNLNAVSSKMAIVGGLEPFKQFLQKLAVASQILGVSGIDCTYGLGQAGFSGSDSCALQVEIYYQPLSSGQTSVVWEKIANLTADEEALLGTLSPEDVFRPQPGPP